MRVLIDTTFARRRPYSGTAVYLERLLDALSRVDGVDVQEACNRGRHAPAGGGLGSARNLFADARWTSTEVPRIARRMRADLIHHPLPARSRLTGLPQAVTVHDLAFERLPDCFDRRFRIYARRAHRAAARAAGAVICVSETTATDTRELWGVDPERIVVAPHGRGQQLPTPHPGHGAEHFLYVGDAEPRKNLGCLLEAYRRYREATSAPMPLVLTGSCAADGVGVRVEGDPGPERLAELYANAVALIQPSLYEGFGMTALEAMAMGTPVVASDISALKEVCREAALYFDPHDPEALAAAMAQLADQPRLRAELSARGRRRAAEFSWESSARAHVAAYSLALAGR